MVNRRVTTLHVDNHALSLKQAVTTTSNKILDVDVSNVVQRHPAVVVAKSSLWEELP